ncbi:MAG: transcription antitermination factor NusB [Bacteroidales bacterium]|jgi:N utilization substance protein B|nr:transcription antitermination factor NusB [Bacteroidales bacterium]
MISRRLLRIKIFQILYAYWSHTQNDKTQEVEVAGEVLSTQKAKRAAFYEPDVSMLNKPVKMLDFSIQKANDLYFYLLLLLLDVKRYAESRIDLAKNKRLPTWDDLHPNTRFIDNAVIRQLETCRTFRDYTDKHKLSWVNYPELIKNLYLNLTKSDYYNAYMNDEANHYEKDKDVLIEFFANEPVESELFVQIMEEQSIFWNDDIDFILAYVIKTIKGMKNDREVELLCRSDENKEKENKDFACKLLTVSIQHYDEYENLIERCTDNWDLERIAFSDKIIMQMAINELIEFPTIPVNVTFDEYLELAKYYSTPKSSVFINGLLDKILTDLNQEGKVVKTGRGLITTLYDRVADSTGANNMSCSE